MKRIITILLICFTATYSAQLYSACAKFSFKSKTGLVFDDDTKAASTASTSLKDFMSFAELDSKQLDYIYPCILDEAKAVKNATDKKAASDAVIDQTLMLEAGAKDFKAVIDASKATMANASAVVKGSIVGINTDKLNTYSTNAVTIAKNLSSLAAGLNSDQNLVVKDKVTKKNDEYKADYNKEPVPESFIGSNKDKDDSEVKVNLAVAGGYAPDAYGAALFTRDLNDGKYNMVSSDPSIIIPDPNKIIPDKQPPTVVNTENNDDDKIEGGTEEAKEIKALTAKIKEMEEKEKEAAKNTPSTASSSDKNTTSPGSSSSFSMGGFNKSFDAERKKRAADLEEGQKKREMQNILKEVRAKTKAPRSTGLAFQKGTSGGLGSSLFGRGDKDAADTSKKTSKPSIFNNYDGKDAGTASKKGDYSGYYGKANIPDSLSSKELAMSRFSSMYEMARRKALIEDAKSEFAGRYIDIFLLQHSIIYDYYSRGLLVDVGEIVTPIQD